MSSRSVVAFIMLAAFIGWCYSNYCDPKLCKGVKHVACNASDLRFGQACGKDVYFVPMNAKMKESILNKHNDLRAQIARGMHGFPQAIRMPTLVWDDELAKIATYNAGQCVFSHDQCRNTKKFKFVGQNLAIARSEKIIFTEEYRALTFIQEWFNEYKNCPPSYVDSNAMSYHGPQIGNFTQIISDRSWKIGCAMTYFVTDGKFTNYYLVCNYSMTNMLNEPIYKKGPMGSKCKTGQNLKFVGLCTPKEKIKSE